MIRPFVSLGVAIPVEVFVLSVGEPSNRAATKIGGLPFWPRGREWPTSLSGEPLPFLAQFNFCQSLDIIGNLPENLLLLFGHQDVPSSIVATWQSATCRSPLIERDDMPVKSPRTCFFGTRWRTDTFPGAQAKTEIILADGTRVTDVWFVCEILGMQIGSRPFFPKMDRLASEVEGGRAICSMCSVYPIADRPFPFLNRPEALTDFEAREFAVDLTDIKSANGFGVLSVVVRDSGEPVVLFENLG
jgi:hypothetical protein